MDTDLQENEYKRSRKAYVTQCTLEHLLGLLIADAFLAKLLSHVGLNDGLIGIVATFTSLAGVFQLLSVYLVQSRISTKRIVIVADVLSQGLFMAIYFVPFIPLPSDVRKFAVMAAVMIAQASKTVISSLYFKWANTYVAPEDRPTFSAKKK